MVHEDDRVDPAVVGETVTRDLPPLVAALEGVAPRPPRTPAPPERCAPATPGVSVPAAPRGAAHHPPPVSRHPPPPARAASGAPSTHRYLRSYPGPIHNAGACDR
jgi:hypothetical protein